MNANQRIKYSIISSIECFDELRENDNFVEHSNVENIHLNVHDNKNHLPELFYDNKREAINVIGTYNISSMTWYWGWGLSKGFILEYPHIHINSNGIKHFENYHKNIFYNNTLFNTKIWEQSIQYKSQVSENIGLPQMLGHLVKNSKFNNIHVFLLDKETKFFVNFNDLNLE